MEHYVIGGLDVIVRYEKLPSTIKGWTLPRSWGFIVLIEASLDPRGKFLQLLKEVRQIQSYDANPKRDRFAWKEHSEMTLDCRELIDEVHQEIQENNQME